MKTKSIIIGLVILCSLITSCDHETIRGTGEVTINEVQFSDYSGLRVSHAFEAFVRFSDTEEKIEIEANDNLHDKIIVRKEGNDLIVRLVNHTNVKGNATLRVYITTKNISYFDISGASTLLLENELNTPTAKIDVSGASAFTGEIYTSELRLIASGASDMALFGNTDLIDASLSGSSKIGGYDLITKQLDIRLAGASDAYMTTMESIDIKASGASTLKYKGDAIVNSKDLSGASVIIKKD